MSATIRDGSLGRRTDRDIHRGSLIVQVKSGLTESQQEENASKVDRSLVESIRCADVPLQYPSQVLRSCR